MKRPVTALFGAFVLAIVVVLVVPLPPLLLDALLATNVIFSAIVLLVSLRVEEPLEFAAFAPALLVATLFRLSLDVSATRLILTHGHEQGGAGAMIPAFGAFVVGGNLVVGLIVFAILITIQFIVIASGAQRVAEVAARFTLDAMPGKQMAIDADVHAGVLDMDGARRKRARLQREADFYGAMDGAGKFVKGDAIAALVIVALNLAGGVAVGIGYQHLAPLEAIDTYALLSIGNALLTTLPAFLISTAMGMMVTRVAADGSLGSDLAKQLFARPDALRGAGVLAGVLAFVPALPMPVFATLSLAAFAGAQLAVRRSAAIAREHESAQREEKRRAIRRPELAFGLVGVDAITLELGGDLLVLAAETNVDALLDRIGEVRRALASEIGLVLPGVRLRDDLTREPATYAIRVRDELVAQGTLRVDALAAVGDPAILATLPGEAAHEPVYGLESRWIAPEDRESAVARGVLVFDPVAILGSHVAECARRHAAILLGRQEFATLVEHLRVGAPATLNGLGGEMLPLARAHKAYTGLLREQAWPRDPLAALEAMVDASETTREPAALTEAARRVVVPPLLRRRGIARLRALLCAPDLEERLARGTPEPAFAAQIREELHAFARAISAESGAVCIVAPSGLRAVLAEFLIREGVRLDVYAFAELPREVTLEPAGMLGAVAPSLPLAVSP